MSDEVQLDQEVYDRLISEGKSERIARAKAKAAAVRQAKIAEGQSLGPKPPEQAEKALEEFRSSAGGGGVATKAAAPAESGAAPGGRLTPEERAARVQASLGNGGEAPSRGVPTSSEHTHRLLALVPPAGIQQVQSKQMDKVYTWPHLLLVEFVSLLAMGALLLIASFFLDAPLGSLANPNEVPAINKAPWYFMGLQELLRYFHPMVAGVTLPGVFLVMLMAAPFIDKNPSAKPENRKVANLAFTFFASFWGLLVLIGSFLRGPGYEWVWPWVEGLGFTL